MKTICRKVCFLSLLSIFFLGISTPLLAEGLTCETHIKNYFSTNFKYPQNTAASAVILSAQRTCLHKRNHLYSDSWHFNEKRKNLSTITSDFKTLKKLIDYQEAADVYSSLGKDLMASAYVDKLNEVLLNFVSSQKAVIILLEQVNNNQISTSHKEILFSKVQDYLLAYGKCRPGICEGWATISLVASAFPVCKKDSCLNYTTYESLYFALANSLGEDSTASDTARTLLNKDFGTSQSNAEVKAPLVRALAVFAPQDFIKEVTPILNKSAKKLEIDVPVIQSGYNEEDALIVRSAFEMLLFLGHKDIVSSYAKGKGISALEANIALAQIPLDADIRAQVRTKLEGFYAQTTACEEYTVSVYHDTPTLNRKISAYLTNDPQLDLQLRERISFAYWTDGNGASLSGEQNHNAQCIPVKSSQKINDVLLFNLIAKDFVRDSIIDTLIFAPIIVATEYVQVIKNIKNAPKYMRAFKYVDKTQDATKVATATVNSARETNAIDFGKIVRARIKQQAAQREYKVAVGQDFSSQVDKSVLRITDRYNYRLDVNHIDELDDIAPTYEKIHRVSSHNSKKSSQYAQNGLLKENSWKLIKKGPSVEGVSWFARMGEHRLERLSKALGRNTSSLRDLFTDPGIIKLLDSASDSMLNEIVDHIENFCGKNRSVIEYLGNTKSFKKMRVEYWGDFGAYPKQFDASKLHFIPEKIIDRSSLKNIIPRTLQKKQFLSKSGAMYIRNPNDIVYVYTELLHCSPTNPCIWVPNTYDIGFKLFSPDGKSFIRVAKHEYSGVRASTLHFHFYRYSTETGLFVNNSIRFDDTMRRSKFLSQILLPSNELAASPSVVQLVK